MHSNVGHWSRGFVAFVVTMLWGISAAYAGTWSDYVDAVSGIMANDNRKLNTRMKPAETAAVKFTVEVLQTGEIKEVVVISSSGDQSLDATAVASVNAVGEFPTPPASVYLRQFFTPLTFTYVFDPKTAGSKNSKTRSVVLPKPIPPEPVVSSPPAVPDEQVASVQRKLIEKGYDPGPVDGFYGSVTASAIRVFQQDNELSANGRISEDLISVLENSSQRDASEANTAVVGVSEQEPIAESTFTPPATGVFSVNRDLVEDYEYVGDRVIQDYDFVE